jgi:predicted phage-related endonuclease
MSLHIYEDLEQGTDAWLVARRGIVTASVVGQLITPKTVKPASNDYSRGLTASLVAERITGYVEPTFQSQDMLRGTLSEPIARDIYAEHHGVTVDQVGFMVREEADWKLGYSPDGLVADDGLIEIKAPRQKSHLATILADEVPLEYMAQCQAGLLVSGRKWLDFISYCGGMPLFIKRVLPDERWQKALVEAVTAFETNAALMIATYTAATEGMPATERIDFFPEMEIF